MGICTRSFVITFRRPPFFFRSLFVVCYFSKMRFHMVLWSLVGLVELILLFCIQDWWVWVWAVLKNGGKGRIRWGLGG